MVLIAPSNSPVGHVGRLLAHWVPHYEMPSSNPVFFHDELVWVDTPEGGRVTGRLLSGVGITAPSYPHYTMVPPC
jgi:hypothetical protein